MARPPTGPRRVAVAERRHVVGEDAVARGGGVGHRLRERPLGLVLKLLAYRRVDRLHVDALGAQLALVALDRVARRPVLEQLLRHVAHVVVRAVAVHTHRLGLDQRRAAAAAGALCRLGRRLEHGLHVVAVDLQAGEAVARRARHGVDRELVVVGGRVGELVVLEDEDDRQLRDAGQVHRLMPDAVRGRALAEPGHRHAWLAAHLERSRQAAGDERHVGEHADHAHAAEVLIAEVHVAVAALRDAARAAHHLRQHATGLHAAHEVGAEIAVEDAGAVLRAEGEARAHGYRFLPASVVVAARDLALAVQRERPLLGGPHEEHEAQEARPVVAGQGIGRLCRVRLRVDERRGSRGGRSHLFSLFGPTGSPPAVRLVVSALYGIAAWHTSCGTWYLPNRRLEMPGRKYAHIHEHGGRILGAATALAVDRRMALAALRRGHDPRRSD